MLFEIILIFGETNSKSFFFTNVKSILQNEKKKRKLFPTIEMTVLLVYNTKC